MNKYEKVFVEIINMYEHSGIWIINNNLKIGFSYIAIKQLSDGLYSFDDETEDITLNSSYGWHDISIQNYFNRNRNLKFCFDVNRAIEGCFITWEEFCKRIDNGESFYDVFYL